MAFAKSALRCARLPPGASFGDGLFSESVHEPIAVVPAELGSSLGRARPSVNPGCPPACTERVEIPEGFVEVPEGAYEGCRELREVNLPVGLSVIGGSAFRRTGLVDVVIPASVTAIGEGAFSMNGQLTSVSIPEGLTFVSARAFMGTGLAAAALPASVFDVGEEAFRDCQSLKCVSFASEVSAGTTPFVGCYALEQTVGVKDWRAPELLAGSACAAGGCGAPGPCTGPGLHGSGSPLPTVLPNATLTASAVSPTTTAAGPATAITTSTAPVIPTPPNGTVLPNATLTASAVSPTTTAAGPATAITTSTAPVIPTPPNGTVLPNATLTASAVSVTNAHAVPATGAALQSTVTMSEEVRGAVTTAPEEEDGGVATQWWFWLLVVLVLLGAGVAVAAVFVQRGKGHVAFHEFMDVVGDDAPVPASPYGSMPEFAEMSPASKAPGSPV
eukprot:TRINITY_DN1749_c0_g1_i9.p1 TRINITY_DN1749_c0_g1~~TRINITY_DN1749_c0_g1_i9.p1  ORF type:complete len:483 (+),score=99.78 TRINITY_DN1749_c0_g1_i9:116-1450(+)